MESIADSCLVDVFGLCQFFSQLLYLLAQGIVILSGIFVDFDLHLEAFGPLGEHQSGQCVSNELAVALYVCEKLGDRVASQRILKVVSKFRIPEGYVFLLFGGLDQSIYDVAKDMQRPVYVATLSQPLPLNIRVLHSLTACQVNDIYFRPPRPSHVLLRYLGFDVDAEDGMGPRALLVHVGFCYFPVLLPLQENVDGFLVVTGF